MTAPLTLILVALFGACCSPKQVDGNHEVRFVWDGLTRQTQLLRENTYTEVSGCARPEILKITEPIIAEQLKKANLTKAQGTFYLIVMGAPPYLFSFSTLQITSPDILELFAAVDTNNVAEIKTLIAKNHNVNQKDLPGQDTALSRAAIGRLASLRTLLDLGADPNICDYAGTCPLQMAAVANSVPSAELLITAGARVDQADETGLTPLMLAADLGRVEVAKELLRSGANPNLKSKKGKTAFDFARESRHQEIVRLLERTQRP